MDRQMETQYTHYADGITDREYVDGHLEPRERHVYPDDRKRLIPPHPERANSGVDSPQWAMIPSMVFESDWPANARNVYGWLCSKQSNNGFASFGQRYCADKMGIHEDTFRDGIEFLQERRAIDVTRTGNGKKHYSVRWNPCWGPEWDADDTIIRPASARANRKSVMADRGWDIDDEESWEDGPMDGYDPETPTNRFQCRAMTQPRRGRPAHQCEREARPGHSTCGLTGHDDDDF